MRNVNEYLFLCDTETNGLRPATSALLEVGFVIADSNFKSLGSMDWLWPSSCGEEAVARLYGQTDKYVQEMHTKNGLWQELYQAGLPGGKCHGWSDAQAEEQMLQMLAQLGVSPNSKAQIVGRNPGFDVKFLEAYAPKVAACFGYHQLDICSIQSLVQRKFGKEAKWDVRQPHRAVADCLNELEELKHYNGYLR